MALTDALDRDVRLAAYRHFAETGSAPSTDDIAAATGASGSEVEDALRRLADQRLLVLEPGEPPRIRMAQPFSAVPTPFRVESGGRSYYGNCIWDALGIPALLDADGTVLTDCADCGEPLAIAVAGGRLVDGDGVAHFAVPAAHWWDDIVDT